MTAVTSPGVTGNGSHTEVSAVSRNTCEELGCKGLDPLHCWQCHSDSHNACAWCEKCMPDGHRTDRRYCSVTCRVRAMHYRRTPEAQEQARAWRESPEGQQRRKILEALASLGPAVDEQARDRFQRALKTGESCASCGRDLGTGPVFLAKARTGGTTEFSADEQRAAAVCADCLCEHHPGQWLECAHCYTAGGKWHWSAGAGSYWVPRLYCRDAGPDHRGQFCEKCHPRQWNTGRCPGCGRTVMFRHCAERRRWVADPEHPEVLRDLPYDQPLPAYCSTRCRSRVHRELAEQRRVADRAPVLCAGCREVMDGHRADARYCSPACRQKAYRRRAGGAS